MNKTHMQFPRPKPSPLTEPFWNATSDHRLIIQRCARCENHIFYPRQRCPYCWSDELTWVDASGRATVACFVGAYKPAHPAFRDDVPYIIALVDLIEGPRMLTNIAGVTPDEDFIGLEATVSFDERGGFTLPVFHMATDR